MIELSVFLWLLILLFAMVGFLRGWTREVVATAGILLALFTLYQFQDVFFTPIVRSASPQQQFFLYSGLLTAVTFFAYQTPGTAARLSDGRLWANRREGLQERLLGAIVGGINGWLFFGSIWYFMFATGYPLDPFIVEPVAGSASAGMINSLPLIFLVQGNLLTILVIVLFLFVIITMI